jgi:hypothetical protein
MNKKILVLTLLLCTIPLWSSASVDGYLFPVLRLDVLDLAVELAPKVPLYPSYAADEFSTDSCLRYMRLSENSHRPAYVYTTVKEDGIVTGLKGYNFDADYDQSAPGIFYYGRAGVQVPFMRLTFGGFGILPSLAVEGILKGGVRTVFNAYGGTDQLGLDGTYFYGASARLGSLVAVTAGWKHYSAHFSDEVLSRVIWYNESSGGPYADPSLDPASFQSDLLDYVRQDPLTFGVSITAGKHLRLYGELRIGDTARLNKPKLFDPADPEFSDFHSREVQFGYELRTDIPRLGPFMLAFDATMREDGKFAMVPTDTATEFKGQYSEYRYVYDPEAPWAFEWGVAVSQSLSVGPGMSARVQASYRTGRFPVFVFGMHRVSYVSVGCEVGY